MTPTLRRLALSALLTLSGAASAVQAGQTPLALTGGPWLNTPAPTPLAGLKGRVVLVNFWVYSCINCSGSLPTLKDWYGRYHAQGLEIVGVHTPESESDRPTASVQAAIREEGLAWPSVQDNARANWNAWGVTAWPTFVLIDRSGRVRAVHVGEISSRYPQAIPALDAQLRALLAEK